MQQLALICPIVILVIFWAVYHYHKDRQLPEPLGHLLLAFGLGIVAIWVWRLKLMQRLQKDASQTR